MTHQAILPHKEDFLILWQTWFFDSRLSKNYAPNERVIGVESAEQKSRSWTVILTHLDEGVASCALLLGRFKRKIDSRLKPLAKKCYV